MTKSLIKTILGKKIYGYKNPLADDLIKMGEMWRFCIFADGSIFLAQADDITHFDMCKVDKTLYIGGLKIESDKILFVIIQGQFLNQKDALPFMKRLIPMESFAQGRELTFKEFYL